MDKQRLRITLKVLDEVKVQFPETNQFIEECLEQQCLKGNISVEEVIFFYKSSSKELAQKNIFYFVVIMLRDIISS